jgi:uncharacterized protein (DUF1330 family)
VRDRKYWSFVAALTTFAAAFGYVEGAVVVYIREISYPAGFGFPLIAPPLRVAATEWVREVATIVLLLGAAFASAHGGERRFAVFAFCFGVWDIVYYVALKAILDWPSHWLEWDVLFLIPAIWIGPVLAPVIVSIGLIGASLLTLSRPDRAPHLLRARDWVVEIVAGLVIIASFLWNANLAAAGGLPKAFPWWLFALGYLGGIGWFGRCWVGRQPFSSRAGRMSMPVYMIISAEVTDSRAYEEYKSKVPALVAKFGGRYLVRGGKILNVIGDWNPGRIIVLEFPSHERLQEWLGSPEYAPLAAIRARATKSKGLVVDGSVDVGTE